MPEPVRVIRETPCENCQGEMVLLCDPRIGLEWWRCPCCGRTEATDAV